MSLSEETKWILVAVIISSNSLFLVKWLLSICHDLRVMMALKMTKLFGILCLCCRKHELEREQLRVQK